MIGGRYTREEQIGRGGMGSVWRARDELLGRTVAIKCIGMFPGGDSPDLERAEREARLAARLNHPNVVAVYDLVPDGELTWLVMEYVDGVTLSTLARDGGLDPDVAAPIVRQVAEALTVAHEAGVIHRDVKPSNILVTPEGVAKLTDFGIARGRADASLTQTGLVTGSPAYLSPEVASGRMATEASDVWSLGASIYQALSGLPPYDVEDNLIGSLYRIVHEEPPRLPDAGVLAPVLASTMVTDPTKRWSMEQVRDYLRGAPIPAVVPAPVRTMTVPEPEAETVVVPTPGAVEEPADQPRRDLRWVVWLLALAAIAAAAGIGWALLNGGEANPPTTEPTPTVSATPKPSPTPTPTPAGPTAEGMTTFITNYLNTVATSPAAAFKQLTPEFQAASNGFSSYKAFWGPVERVEVSNIVADPATLQVSYDVRYFGQNLKTDGGHVELILEHDNGTYLIAAEPTG